MRSIFLIVFIYLSAIATYSQPKPRHLEELTFDKQRNRLILFGGVELNDNKFSEPSMVFEWDGKKWEEFHVPGPVGRRAHALVFDEAENIVILSGGVTAGGADKDSLVFDTWVWNGRTWKFIDSACPVKEPEAVYDRVSKRVLVYGQARHPAAGDAHGCELWQYKERRWKKLSSGGPDITGVRMMSFDEHRNKVIIPVNEAEKIAVWEWQEDKWEKVSRGQNAPSNRTRFAIGYHPVTKLMYFFGGLTFDRKTQLGDFWQWDGKNWKQIATTQGPSIRNSTHFIMCKDQLILYGGSIPKPAPAQGIEACNEIWSWKDNVWTLIPFE